MECTCTERVDRFELERTFFKTKFDNQHKSLKKVEMSNQWPKASEAPHRLMHTRAPVLTGANGDWAGRPADGVDPMGRTSRNAEMAGGCATAIAVKVAVRDECDESGGSTEGRSDGERIEAEQRLEIQTAKCVE